MPLTSFLLVLVLAAACLPSTAEAQERSTQPRYSFGVIPQRSPTLTAQYWNPILQYVSDKSGIALELSLARSAAEHSDGIRQGRFAFLYSNHNFVPENAAARYRVIARPRAAAIRGEIVVLAASPLKDVPELQGREIAFPSNVAFVAYQVPMDALEKLGIRVKPVFAGNQEGAMGQLKSGRVEAAAVNSRLMRDFAEREVIRYRVLWRSEEYLNIPISAHPSVPGRHVDAVGRALQAMDADPQGARVLEASATLVKQSPPYGFLSATDKEYESHRRFYAKSGASPR
jgi:phosphonate transport system substrate-binding protein